MQLEPSQVAGLTSALLVASELIGISKSRSNGVLQLLARAVRGAIRELTETPRNSPDIGPPWERSGDGGRNDRRTGGRPTKQRRFE